ncbi:hypothetical protein ACJIZ3_013694 [Penstemon smallii]|uniref:CCT domain-containing protein n=1 Tax=Penstemon smallii TaxID=265156 RepID=A0ABD3RP67_9LAMI
MLNIEEITSSLGAQILEFCESELLPQTIQNSEVVSSSNCCYEDMNKYNNTIDNETNPVFPTTGATTSTAPCTSTTTTAARNNNNNLSIIFDEDEIEDDISASCIDFTSSPISFSIPPPHHHHQYINQSNNQEPFNINQLSLTDMVGPPPPPPAVVPMLGHQIPTGYDQDEFGLNSVPSYNIRLRTSTSTSAPPSCSLMDPMIGQYLPSTYSLENCGINFTMLGNDISNQDLDFQGSDNGGMFFPDTMQRAFNCSSELQALSSESQHMVHGGASSAPLASEISSLDDPTFKVGKLSVEERKRKIHRYMKKRNERNFSKKIKYACRKTLADSRPRVRGRFAKNDELGIGEIGCRSTNEYDIDNEDLFNSNHQSKVVVKEEDDIDSSDIFAHISGVNSFKCNYPIQSWI